jgi:hypothetical protein
MVVADLIDTITRWRENPARELFADGGKLDESSAHDCATRAEQLLRAGRQTSPDATTAQICLLTKRPHAGTDRPITALIGRLLAAGVQVHEVRRLRQNDDGRAVIKALYPVAHAYYAEQPANDTVWRSLGARFDNDRFTSVFGVPYSPDMIMSGAAAVAEFGLTENALTAIWEEGRRPVARETLVSRYGITVADTVVNGGSHYSWFRGEWPLGIQRIAPGLVAFAMRHEQVGGGRPVIVLNGHVPGLAELFGEGTAIIEAGLSVPEMTIAAMRRWVIGHDNRPENCEPGTIRRDAADGTFPVDSGVPVDSRRNVVHSSDGFLAGVIESRALLDRQSGSGALVDRLCADGLTAEEVETIVLRDPVVVAHGEEQTLSDLTRGKTLDECATAIARAFPPVFGAANGFANGLSLPTFVREIGKLAAHNGDPASYSHRDVEVRTPAAPAIRPTDLSAAHEAAGTSAIGAGKVAFVVPAGGTGGRFGSYDLPESHPSRQKALVKMFQVGGAAVCGLDLRLANARYWRAVSGGRLPVAVMASPTSRASVSDWAAGKRASGVPDLVGYEQSGIYRLRSDVFSGQHSRWFDRVLRNGDGSPSLKPPGNLGTLTCLAIAGTLDAWANDGIEFLVIANGDDVGFRLDPKILGMLVHDAGSDAIVAGVPWGLSGVVTRPDGQPHVRIEDGWCVDETGRTGHAHRSDDGHWDVDFDGFHGRVQSPTVDKGGAICELRTEHGWQLGIAETATPDAFSAPPLFSTNQFYVRVSAVRRAMGLPNADTIGAVRNFAARQPFYAERKLVATDVGMAEALQLTQGANDVIRHMRMAAVELSRHGTRGGRGGYAALKSPKDLLFGQLLLDRLAKNGDDLAV